MKPILLAGSSLLVLSSCSITQESPVNIKGLSNVLSSTASQELQRAGEEACRKAGYSNFSSNILVFSTDVSYHLRAAQSWTSTGCQGSKFRISVIFRNLPMYGSRVK